MTTVRVHDLAIRKITKYARKRRITYAEAASRLILSGAYRLETLERFRDTHRDAHRA
jgi:hypothetical protein